MQITAPLPIYYLPENLWSLFTRPGRELTVRVLQIEEKFLYLELGGYKFQARLAGTLNPEDFKPGELLRVKVLKSEGPVVLEVVGSEKGAQEQKLLYLLVKERASDFFSQPLVSKELSLLSQVIKNLVKNEEIKEKKEIFKKLDDFIERNLKISDFVLEEDRLFIPFVFVDEKSWGYLEVLVPEDKGGRIKVFQLKLFFQYLGLVEALFWYDSQNLYIDIYFSEKEAYEEGKRELLDLKNTLPYSKNSVKISVLRKKTLPGILFSRVG